MKRLFLIVLAAATIAGTAWALLRSKAGPDSAGEHGKPDDATPACCAQKTPSRATLLTTKLPPK